MKSNSKNRLFEVMSKVDKTFKPKLNEDFNSQPTETNLNVDEVLNGYLETALWAEGGDGGKLSEKSIYDIDQKSKQQAKNDIIQFLQIAKQQAPDELNAYDAETLGHNFWLSRNGHGAGFFDDNNDQLQDIAKKFKSVDIYTGDDGNVYITTTNNIDKTFNPEMNEASGVNRKYTHFAVVKGTNKIVNGWDYKGFEPEELRLNKKHYFFNDIRDMQIDPRIINVVTTKHLQKLGIDPFNYENWNKDDSVFTL